MVARLTATAEGARDLLDRLAEVFDASEAVVSAYDTGSGWAVAIHFNDPPNETAVRALVGLAAGPEAANALAFETLAAKDWVKASQEGLKPVEAGRFIVHSEHYRSAVRANRIGIEIGTAFAFGTGHHGTTRGCLLALDHLLKSRRPRRILDIGTGTAVLAIAAARVLHRPVLASDIDRRAARVARENVRRNRRRHRDGRSCRRYRHAAVSRPRAVRPRAREHPARAVAADGDADGAAARAGRPRRALRTADVTGKRRARGLSA